MRYKTETDGPPWCAGGRAYGYIDADSPEEAVRRALRGIASDFSAPRKVREGTDLYGPYVEFTASRLCGREFASVKVRS